MIQSLRQAWMAIRWTGIATVWRALRYTWTRDWLDRRWTRPQVGPWQGWGRVHSLRQDGRCVLLSLERGELELCFLAPDVVRVSWLPGREPIPYAIARPEAEWPHVVPDVQLVEAGWDVSTEALRVHVGQDGALAFYDAQGALLREDLPPERGGERVRHRAWLQPEEHIYGLGERATGADHRGGRYVLWNRDPGGYGLGDDPLYLNIPVYVGMHARGSYLVFFENTYRATFDLGSSHPEQAEHIFDGGMLRYYFISGPPPRALERYTELTGRPPLPPLWALGYHQSRYSYYPEARVRRLAEDFRRHDVPVDVIHLDIHYMHGYRVFTWDRERFPDPKALLADLRAQGIRVVVIIDPGIKVDSRYHVYRDGLARGVFCRLPNGRPLQAPVWPGWCAFPDFTDPAARSWWGEQYRALVDVGVAGFWNDMNEPATFAAWGDMTFPLCTRHALEGRGGDHREAHNVYGMQMVRAGYEGLRRLASEQRPVFISRSGWAGLQRYSWNWTGDNYTDWTSFYLSIPMLISLGMSGIPFTGPDIGGFMRPKEGEDEFSPELYTRWLQAGAFFPFFRTHTALGLPDKEPWTHGEPYLTYNREAIRLRYRLLPYIYTLAWEAHRYGWPLVRPLWWLAPQEEALWTVDDAFLLGDALLVAPVLSPGARRRRVRLPSGYVWYDFWSDAVYAGGQVVEVEAPLDRIPLFVREGTVLPLAEPGHNAEAMYNSPLTLRVFPPQAGQVENRMYTDAGEGWAYTRGEYRVDHFLLAREAERVRLTWTHEGTYLWPYPQVRFQVPPAVAVRGARVEGVDVPWPEGEGTVEGPVAEVVWY